MKKTIKILLLVLVYLLIFSTYVHAYTANFSGTPSTVNSGQKFTVKVTVDEATVGVDSVLRYDSSLFTFVEAKDISATPKTGEIAWTYFDFNSGKGTNTFEFTFEAKKVTKDTTGTFSISNGSFTTAGGNTYDAATVKGDKTVSVTVKAGTKSSASTNNTMTSGSKTNQKATTTYNNTVNNATSDTTKTPESTLPKTGDNKVKNVALIAGVSLIVLAIVYKRKSKNLF